MLGRENGHPEGTRLTQILFPLRKIPPNYPLGPRFAPPVSHQPLSIPWVTLSRNEDTAPALRPNTMPNPRQLFVRHPVRLASDISAAERRSAEGSPGPVLCHRIRQPDRQPKTPAGESQEGAKDFVANGMLPGEIKYANSKASGMRTRRKNILQRIRHKVEDSSLLPDRLPNAGVSAVRTLRWVR